jgi:hypothetical protein
MDAFTLKFELFFVENQTNTKQTLYKKVFALDFTREFVREHLNQIKVDFDKFVNEQSYLTTVTKQLPELELELLKIKILSLFVTVLEKQNKNTIPPFDLIRYEASSTVSTLGKYTLRLSEKIDLNIVIPEVRPVNHPLH